MTKLRLQPDLAVRDFQHSQSGHSRTDRCTYSSARPVSHCGPCICRNSKSAIVHAERRHSSGRLYIFFAVQMFLIRLAHLGYPLSGLEKGYSIFLLIVSAGNLPGSAK